ncbi:C/D box methylation guide ribonucleoprotein complex aNOP56 subunit [archaeon]|nr:C/D box methylation guide ribonucleoprotein complex aNOP56 subunit [archaeon]
MTVDLRKKLIYSAKQRVKEVFTGRDFHINKASRLIEDFDDMFNLLSEHAREWHSIYFPELNTVIEEHEPFLRIISQVGEKKNYSKENLLKAYANEKKAVEALKALRESMGSDLKPEDLIQVKALAENALSIKRQRNALEAYLEQAMNEYCPNLKAVAGTLIGAKLLTQGHGLKRMALMPSSTIQLLGAEKALFKHLKTGSKPPKYGVLFQHPLVRQGKPWNKGKIARALAAKISIAAKQDFFNEKKELIAEGLLAELERRAKEIDEQHPNPPSRKPEPSGAEQRPEQNEKRFERKPWGDSQRQRPFRQFRKFGKR